MMPASHIERRFAYWSHGGGTATMGAAAGGDDQWHRRAPARVGTARARWFLVGVGVLGAGVRRPALSQGGPGARRQPAPAGATRGLPASATAPARPRRAQPSR